MRLWTEMKRAFERSLGWRPTDEDYTAHIERLDEDYWRVEEKRCELYEEVQQLRGRLEDREGEG